MKTYHLQRSSLFVTQIILVEADMAGIAHLGVGLAAKRLAPQVPVPVLIAGAYAIDIVWSGFYLAGLEHLPEPGVPNISPYSHGLLMSTVWSLLAGMIAARISRNRKMGWVMGLVVFSHWVVDFISHPMTAVFPGDSGLPLFFAGSPLVGLGVWSTPLGVQIGEYGILAVGLAIYLLTRLYKKNRDLTGMTV
jgi:hypothetical protein